jgi:hypothetical protein
MLPFIAPFRHLAMTIMTKLLLKPKTRADRLDPMQPYPQASTAVPIAIVIEHALGPSTHQKKYRFPPDPVTQRSPVEDGQQLSKREQRFDLK